MRILELNAPYFRAVWRREHDVLAWGDGEHCDLHPTGLVVRLADLLRQLPAGWRPDLIVLGDDSRLLRVLDLDDPPCPTLMLSIDAHHHAAWHAPLASAFDLVFVAQRDHLPAYHAAGAAGARWLPLWAPDGLPAPAAEKTHAVSFVGTLDPRLNPLRVVLVQALRGLLPLHVAQGPWVEVFTRSRIVLNQTVKGDLNFRVFEAMACGALLLTERTGNGLLELFTEGEHLVTYPRSDVEAIVATAEAWLASERERERAAVAERGRATVLAAHLERHRAAEVMDHVARHGAARSADARRAGVARAYCVQAHYAGRLAESLGPAFYGPLRDVYLAEASVLAARAALPEPDRRAVLGMVALESGDLGAAIDHLASAAEHGGRPEDAIAHVEALVRAGRLGGVRAALERLRATHPDYAMAPELQRALARAGLVPEGEAGGAFSA